MQRLFRSTAACLLLSLVAGCGEDEPERIPTFPVKGIVYVDGKAPDSQIAVRCVPVSGGKAEAEVPASATFTKPDGTFEISTFKSGDGVPAGEYVLTFEWGSWNRMTAAYGGPDKLKGRYNDPKKSEFKVTVEKGKPIDLGRIELKTAGK